MLRRAFAPAAEKRRGGEESAALVRAIRSTRPDLAGASFYMPMAGNSAYVLMTEKEVFKSPLHPNEDTEDFRNEMRIMSHLQGKGLCVPELTYIHEEQLIYGMTRMEGVTASEVFRHMKRSDKVELGRDLAAFALGLHQAFSGDGAYRYLVKGGNAMGDLQYNIAAAKRSLADDVVADALGADTARTAAAVDAYEDSLINHRKPMVIVADFHDDNILINPQTKRLSAMIDIGYLEQKMPEIFLRRVARYFGPRTATEVALQIAQKVEGFTMRDFHGFALTQALVRLQGMNENDAQEVRKVIIKALDQLGTGTKIPSPVKGRGVDLK